MWLNIKNFRLLEGLSHKFLGPYAGPFCRNPTLAKCEDETHTPKVGDLESFGTFEFLEFNNKAQITSH